MVKKRVEKHKHKEWSGLAIAGFVLSLFFITSILGIIFSAFGLSATSKGKKKGRGLAIAGLIISIFFTFMGLLAGIAFIFMSNVLYA